MKFDLRTKEFDPLKSGIQNFSTIARFYMYYSPNIDSKLSKRKKLSKNLEKRICNITNVEFIKRIKPISFKKRKLDGNILEVDDIGGLIGVRQNEENSTALFRVIRNCLAHARVYKSQNTKKNCVLFEDVEENKIKARFVLSIKELTEIMNILIEECSINFKK